MAVTEGRVVSLFGHSGCCAKLEDWFDPRRVGDDYACRSGWKPHDRRTYVVKVHSYGLVAVGNDRRALIAFLKPL